MRIPKWIEVPVVLAFFVIYLWVGIRDGSLATIALGGFLGALAATRLSKKLDPEKFPMLANGLFILGLLNLIVLPYFRPGEPLWRSGLVSFTVVLGLGYGLSRKRQKTQSVPS